MSTVRAYIVHVPVNDNDGNRIPQAAEKTNQKLIDTFGGFSYLGQIVGGWRDPDTGKVYIEPMHRYEIATANAMDVLDFAVWVKNEFNQISVYVRFSDGSVDFVS